MSFVAASPARRAAAAPDQTPWRDVIWLASFSLLLLAVHLLLGNRYGFHRDELQFLSDARHLRWLQDWGFVAYPPVTAMAGRLAVDLFGLSPAALRVPAVIANGATLVLAGLLARELGGRRPAQMLTATLMLPVTVVFSSVLQYNTFDLLAWTLCSFGTARVLRTADPRQWLWVGTGAGFGVLSKYAIAFALVSLLAGLLLLPSQRHHLRSGWFWLAALLACTLAAPNLLWLTSHHFITLRMESSIHARDVRLGRADGYWTDQLRFTLLGLPLAVLGLISLLRRPRYRLLAAFFVGPLLLLALLRGRGYYLLPGYTVLWAAAMVRLEDWLRERRPAMRPGLVRAGVVAAALLNMAAIASLYLPLFRPGSAAWRWQVRTNSDMADEVGWPDFVAQVAQVRDGLSAEQRAHLGVLADNYGEAGALELFGPRYGLPAPISSVNSFHARGWGTVPPETVIVVGSRLEDQQRNFEHCRVAAQVHMPFGIRNEESVAHPDLLVCSHLRSNWPAAWSRSQAFG